ncbi:MAG: hypothetical protein DCC55_25055 [Chloroflexi bacterium]|nr:MAG: hypothetical protein DCC55_25055 [Chloroflexota bacterium]
MTHPHSDESAWLHGHAHEPNPAPPTQVTAITVNPPSAPPLTIDVADLHRLPTSEATGCYIVSTGHGTSGPFTFAGVRLGDLIDHVLGKEANWRYADVVSADGFGTRVHAHEAYAATGQPILMAHTLDGAPLTRAQGLVRLIVPTETDDALRQVKWVAKIRIQ